MIEALETRLLLSSVTDVYFEDFSGTVGAEWSDPAKSVANSEWFLASSPTGFGNGTVTLSLADLPEHSAVQVQFDLYIIQTWDGDNGGPDGWQLAADGQTVIDSTFACYQGGSLQTWPDQNPPLGSGTAFAAGTGAYQTGHLGFGTGPWGDQTYHVSLNLSHMDSSLVLAFTSLQNQGSGDEGWGLDNVLVRAMDTLDPPGTTYVVDSTEDNHVADGKVTLREAITAANSDLPDGDAEAGFGWDTITFDPSLIGQVITLGGDQLVIADDLTIVGLGQDNLTIDAQSLSRHFEVNGGRTLEMYDLKLVNGNAREGNDGGSILCDGTVNLTRCTLDSNVAAGTGGAISISSFSAEDTLSYCTLSNNTAGTSGGGVWRDANYLTLDHCLLADNTAVSGSGGGLYASGQAAITDSDFQDNSASTTGGGIYCNGRLTVTGGQLVGNLASSGGGICTSNATTTLSGVLLQQNRASLFSGGGIYSAGSGTTQVTGSTFDQNRAAYFGAGVYASGGFWSATGTHFTDNFAVYYGGAGYMSGISEFRDCDFVGNSTDRYDGGALYTSGSPLVWNTRFENNEAGRDGGAIRHYGGQLTVSSTTFDNNFASGTGGALRLYGPATILNTAFTSNQAGGNGGAISASEDTYTLALTDSVFDGNQGVNGGAIWTNQRRVQADGVVLVNNTASKSGGAVYLSEGYFYLADGLVSANSAGGGGGAVWVDPDGELEVTNSTVYGNSSVLSGGGLYLNGNRNPAVFVHATIAANRSDSNGTHSALGGGIYTTSDRVLLSNSIVASNLAGAGTAASDIAGTVDAASSHSLVGDASSAGGTVNGVNGNLVDVDPVLGPLQDNGGRSDTCALLPGSPAIDAGDNAMALYADGEPIWYDQRGRDFDRLVGLYVDMGAFEYQTAGGTITGRKWFDLDQDGQPDEPWGASIVVNGSFEEGSWAGGSSTVLNLGATSVQGWLVAGSIDWINMYWVSAEGSRSIDLNATDAGAIQQVLITEPGRRYRVQFALAGNPGGIVGPKTVRVSASWAAATEVHQDFIFDTTGQTRTDMGWQTQTWEFVAQESMTLLTFESLSPGSAFGPAIDNVVVQPFGRDDVLIYIDQDGSGGFDAGEPLTFLRLDDPTTPATDETGTYRFTGLPAGQYTVAELLAPGLIQVAPAAPGTHSVQIVADETVADQDFGNRWDGTISGTKFLDINGNGVRDRNLFPGSLPTVFLVIDVSDTTLYTGFTVGDVNGDGASNNVLDVEIFSALAVWEEMKLLDAAWDGLSQVGVIVFASQGVALDMDPVTPGVQLLTNPWADLDANDVDDVKQVLLSIRRIQSGTGSGDTDFELALDATLGAIADSGAPADATTVILMSDGLSNNPWSFDEQVQQLREVSVQQVGWGFGSNCDMSDLRRVDPLAVKLNSIADVVLYSAARSRLGIPGGDGQFLEPGLPDVTIYIDSDGNGQLDPNEPATLSRHDDPGTPDVDETGWYAFMGLPIGQYVVREIVPAGYVPTVPVDPDYYTVDLRSGPVASGYDFGNRLAPGGIQGTKGLDADLSGTFDAGEPGQPGVTIYLDLNNNAQRDSGEPSTVTNASGGFAFTGLSPGTYRIREVPVDGFDQVTPDDGEALVVEVLSDQVTTGLLLVNQDVRGCLQGLKWLDLDGDGERSKDEPGMADVRIYLDTAVQDNRGIVDRRAFRG